MNLGELTALIQEDLVDERLTSQQIQGAILASIEFYARQEFYFNIPIYNFPIVPEKEIYTVADNPYIKDTFSIKLVIADLQSTGRGLIDLTPYNIQNDYPIRPVVSPTLPRFYTYNNFTLRLTPPSSYPGTLTVVAAVKFAPLASESDTNMWLQEASEMIRASAKRRLCLNVFHDREMAEGNAILEREQREYLERETTKRLPETLMSIPYDLLVLSGPGMGYDIRYG
jgi:hypothetical protein